MTRHSALASLFALVALALAACVGPFASDDATPPVAGTTEGFATICGIELITSAARERDQGARDCFLDGHAREEHRELLFVEISNAGIEGQLVVTRDGALSVRQVFQRQEGMPSQSSWICDRVNVFDDTRAFALDSCTAPEIQTGELSPDPATAICGLEIVVHSLQHHAADARRCLFEAFESGTPARFYSMLLTVEGAPITEVYSVVDVREVEMLIDNRDAFGTPGLTLERCTQLLDADPPLVWEPANCFLVRKVVR